MTVYSKRRQEQCVHCAAGWPSGCHGSVHYNKYGERYDCTARDAEEEIAELRVKLEQAEEDKVRLSTAVCSMGQARIRESLRAEQAERERDEERARVEWYVSRFGGLPDKWRDSIDAAREAQKGAEDAE